MSHGYLSLLNDISYFRCTRRTKIWAFSRNDIKEIFSLEAKMIKRLNQDPCARPLKGVLMTSISNYILKSRNDYNSDYIVKYIPSKDAMSAAANNQIWIREISCLNDDREGALLSEIMSSTDWNSYEWASSVDLKPKRKYYISSFSKSYVDDKMLERYGDCIYGFKDDRLADLLAPIYIQHFENKETGEKKDIPAFSQVVCYDVIYDIEESKKEISYLCDLIDCFDIPDASKHSFLEEILQYWIYSVKDANKWKQERERRYIPFLYDDYEYIELDLTDPVYAKLKTSVFLLPDFIMGNTPCKGHIEKYIENKMNVLSTKKFCYCMNCLSRDYDSVLDYNVDGERKCSVCGSKSVKLVTPSHV